MMKIADWMKTNYLSIADWMIAVAAIIAPIVLSKPERDKITHKKNMVTAYIAFMIKISFYYFALICIFYWVGNFLHISNYFETVNKKKYLDLCVILSFIPSVIVAVRWTSRTKIMIKCHHNIMRNIFTYVITTGPIVVQLILNRVVLRNKMSFHCWAFLGALLNVTFVIAAFLIVDGHDFFDYSEILLHLKNSDEVHAVIPDTICCQGNYIAVDVNANHRIRYPAENIKKLQYLRRNKYRSGVALSITHKILSLLFSFWYFFVIGLVSQFLFSSVIIPIFVTENQIVLEKGDYYQIEAVSLNSDTNQLQYTISGDNAICVSPSGVISVNRDLPEGKYVTAEITITDEIGNAATVQVEVRS